jgi:DNA-binding transcriptional regulator YiaG
MKHGLTLRKAHELIDRLALGEEVVSELSTTAPNRLLADLAEAGVAAAAIVVPDVDVRAIRGRLDISQAEFATRFGFALDSVKNWEQGRYRPDDAARTLLTVIDRHARLVDDVLRGPSRSNGRAGDIEASMETHTGSP